MADGNPVRMSASYPNVFVIGAAKSGTTTLVAKLGRHPGVFVPALKEPFYFAFPETKPNWTGPGDPNGMPVYRLNEYLALYEQAKDKPVRIDGSTVYLYDPAVPARIAQRIPDAKIIVMLRHPVDRAYSAFLHVRGRTTSEKADFAEALSKEASRITAGYEHLWHYRAMSRYSSQLKRWYEHFPSSSIRVHLYDNLVDRPRELYADICAFLNLDTSLLQLDEERENVSAVPRNIALKKLMLGRSPLKKAIARILPLSWRRSIWKWNTFKPQCPPDLREALIREFAQEVLEVQEVVGRDLSHWLPPDAKLPAR